eukprot:10941767-Alexandrium_andersonii.AAC.1
MDLALFVTGRPRSATQFPDFAPGPPRRPPVREPVHGASPGRGAQAGPAGAARESVLALQGLVDCFPAREFPIGALWARL